MGESDSPTLISTRDGFTVWDGKAYLYSRSSPRKRAVRRSIQYEIEPNTLYFLPSPLLFYGVPELLHRSQEHENVHFLGIETDPSLMKLSFEHIPSEVQGSDRISTIRCTTVAPVIKEIERLGNRRFRRIRVVTLNGGYLRDKERYDSLISSAQAFLAGSWRNRMTLIRMGRLWLKNLFYNLHVLSAAEGELPCYGGAPVVVAGAGESIEHASQWLKEHRGKYILVAVDTALPTLFDLGVRPDIVVVLESQIANYYDFLRHGDAEELSRMRIVADITSCPTLMRKFFGALHITCTRFAPVALLDRIAISCTKLPALGSVGVTAVYAAMEMTTGPILLTGLDFSYLRGKTHARGAPAHTLQLITRDRLSGISFSPIMFDGRRVSPNNDSPNPVERYTNTILESYKESLSKIASHRKRIFDTNPSSIFSDIPVASRRNLNELFAEYQIHRTVDTQNTKPEKNASARRREIVETLEYEQHLLYQALRRFRRILDGDEVSATDEKLLKDTDYLFVDFPDLPEHPLEDAGFLRRLIVSAEYYRDAIAKSLQMSRIIPLP